jgi:thiamine-monophosphate kinase
MRVKDIGEQGLLNIVQGFCPQDIIGDDAAIFQLSPQHSLVVTTDVLVDGVHFSDGTTTAEDVGWRCIAANLSDLAAMGANPVGITVGLGLPADVTVDWVKSFYQGMKAGLDPYHIPILGGDLVRSPVITINITALGEVMPERAILRSTAQPGDVILVTGFHGCARAGLELLLNPELGQYLEPVIKQQLIKTHQRPQPRLDVIKILTTIKTDVTIAGMDSSDGLADAVIQICRCSGVGAEIYRDAIPILPALELLTSKEKALDWVLYGGEDFELVLCLPLSPAELLIEHLGDGSAIIGQIVAGNIVELIDREGIDPRRLLNLSQGFQHF